MSLPTITPAEAKRLIAQGATLIDIRDKDEHAREHIAVARNRPLGTLSDLGGVKGPIIFHCRAGKRTSDNANRLQQAADCEAYILEGGIEGWKQAGLPVVVDESQPIENQPSGDDRRRQPRADRRAARCLRKFRLLCAVRTDRRGSCLCRREWLLRHGQASCAHALEPRCAQGLAPCRSGSLPSFFSSPRAPSSG